MKPKGLIWRSRFAILAIVVIIIIGFAIIEVSHGLWHEDFNIVVSMETGDWNHTCVRSASYWRTHSECSTNPHRDPAWSEVGEDTPFFDSQETWCSALWVPNQGDVYWSLAKQYIAVRLNAASGAEIHPILEAILNQTEIWFQDHSPGTIDENDDAYEQASLFKAVLKEFNTGQFGPSVCSDSDNDEGEFIDNRSDVSTDTGVQVEGEQINGAEEDNVQSETPVDAEVTPTETPESDTPETEPPPTDDSPDEVDQVDEASSTSQSEEEGD